MYVAISSIAISPDGNLSNMFISDNGKNIWLKFGKNHVIMKNPIVITPAIIWFSVMLDANIPNEMYAILSIRKPISVTITVCICGFPKKYNIARYINVHISVIIITNTAAKNLPNTMLVILLGDVYNSCSVPNFLSSANILIVRIGTIYVNTVAAE